MISFDIPITYSQIAVFNSNLENPFNDWSDDQVSQGFSWREGSVSFKTLINDAIVRVEFDVVGKFVPSVGSLRTISVPFKCNQSGEIEIATITDAQPLSVKSGVYQLVFECGSEPDDWCRISLVVDGDLEPKILVADADLAPSYPLIMEAHSA
jgi:hypothetical protein